MTFSDCGVGVLTKGLMPSLGLALLLVSTPAPAKDYRLDFGVETSAGSDAGSVVCTYGRCVVKADQLKLTIGIYLSADHADQALVDIEGEVGCCFFEGGARTQGIIPLNPPPKIRFFVGRPGRGLLYVQNEYAGNLYLRFHLD